MRLCSLIAVSFQKSMVLPSCTPCHIVLPARVGSRFYQKQCLIGSLQLAPGNKKNQCWWRNQQKERERLTMNPGRTLLQLPHGQLQLPLFLPDATLGVVRSVDSTDLEHCGIDALVMNIFHLMQRPGSSTVTALGGLHTMAGWPHPIITDSGGFQAYSLIRQNAK